MDGGLMLKAAEAIREGKVPVKRIIEEALFLENTAANTAALAACIKDGTVFNGAGIKTLQDHGHLLYALQVLKEAGEEVAKAATSALKGTEERKGQDGLAARFAEFLREQGLSRVHVEGVGTCYIQSTVTAVPPNKSDPRYEEFRQWARDQGLTTESWQWQGLQSKVRELVKAQEELGAPAVDGGTIPTPPGIPEFISIVRRDEVRLRQG